MIRLTSDALELMSDLQIHLTDSYSQAEVVNG